MNLLTMRLVVASHAALIFGIYSAFISAQTLTRATDKPQTGSTILRILKDPVLDSSCWLLKRDPTHPEGPGTWFRTSLKNIPILSDNAQLNAGSGVIGRPVHPVIRGGDQLVIEENSDLVDARLQAVALGPAVQGEALEVRLRTTGMVLRAVALGSGRASIVQVRP
jgi:hypothetical protein